MSYFDVMEREIIERENEEAEIQMSNDHQKEIDEENAITITVGEIKEIMKTLSNAKNVDFYVVLLKAIIDAKVGTEDEKTKHN